MKHTPEHSGSGQIYPCAKCNLPPTKEGHDGCLGTLDISIVMNACCGHGNPEYAYIQYWDSSCIRGDEATTEINNLMLRGNECKNL